MEHFIGYTSTFYMCVSLFPLSVAACPIVVKNTYGLLSSLFPPLYNLASGIILTQAESRIADLEKLKHRVERYGDRPISNSGHTRTRCVDGFVVPFLVQHQHVNVQCSK